MNGITPRQSPDPTQQATLPAEVNVEEEEEEEQSESTSSSATS